MQWGRRLIDYKILSSYITAKLVNSDAVLILQGSFQNRTAISHVPLLQYVEKELKYVHEHAKASQSSLDFSSRQTGSLLGHLCK